MITSFPSRPGGKTLSGYHRAIRTVQDTAHGYRIIRTPSCFSPQRTAAQKLLENLSFGFTSTLQAAILQSDVIYANTWPVVASAILTFAHSAPRKVPLVLSIQDIHPEAAVSLGRLAPDGWGTRLLKWLDRQVVHRASAIVTISDRFARHYRRLRDLPPEKVHVVSNWMDEAALRPGPHTGPIRQSLGIAENAFVALYAGNIGEVAGVEVLLHAAARLASRPEITFVIAGEGSQRGNCQQLAATLGLSNVRFLHPLTPEAFPDVQAMADVTLLPTRHNAAMTSVPSKLIAYMLSARPVLAAVHPDSDTAEIIDTARCGLHVQPEAPSAIAHGIGTLMNAGAELTDMGTRAANYAVKHCSKTACVPRLVKIIENCRPQTLREPAWYYSARKEGSVTALDSTDSGGNALNPRCREFRLVSDPGSWTGPVTAVPRNGDQPAGVNLQVSSAGRSGRVYSCLPLRGDHVPAVVSLHMHAFPDFFLTKLGPRFLGEFYSSFADDAEGVAIVAEDSSRRIQGVIAGPLRPDGFFRRLLVRRWWAFALAALRTAVCDPAVLPRLARALTYRGNPPAGPRRALLSSIAVSPESQGAGVGRQLVQRWLREVRARGAAGCYLTTDADENERTNRFYLELGWILADSYVTSEGRHMNRYVLDFSDTVSAAETRRRAA